MGGWEGVRWVIHTLATSVAVRPGPRFGDLLIIIITIILVFLSVATQKGSSEKKKYISKTLKNIIKK